MMSKTTKPMTDVTRLGALLILAAGATACSSSPATGEAERDDATLDPDSIQVANDERSLHLVAQIGLHGRVVKFFEPEPGTLLTMEKGISEEAEKDPQEAHLSGAALYEFLAKAPAPEALRLAEARATPPSTDDGAGTVDHDPEPAAPSASGAGLRAQTEWDRGGEVSRSSFLSSFCTPTDRFYSRKLYSTRTWLETTGTNMMQAGVRGYEGLTYYDAHYGSRLTLWADLDPGWYAGWRYTSGINVTARTEAYPSSGGSVYDHCANYHF